MTTHPAPNGLERFELRLPAEVSSPAAGRAFVRETLSTVQADTEAVADLQLVVSELITNAIEHGAGNEVQVELHLRRDHAELIVTSVGNTDRVAPPDRWEVSGPEAVTGRGLGIVRAVSDHVDLRRKGDIVQVTAGRRLRAIG